MYASCDKPWPLTNSDPEHLELPVASPVDDIWHSKGADGLAHVVQQGLAHAVVVAARVGQRHVCVDGLALDGVVHPADGGSGQSHSQVEVMCVNVGAAESCRSG